MTRIAIATGLLLASLQVSATCPALLDRSFRPLAGKSPVNLCERHAGHVLLVVNTASKCGFTPQYEGLEALHAKYAERGFAVLGFPSNDFMGQEPGSEEEIREFCTLCHRPPQWSHFGIGVMEPVDDRRNGATSGSP
ncbi:MAG: hypothetical protein AMXMBFR25_20880 [Lysobacterales bacterium]|nr:hypothetical protein [Xanthomonadales bacterium]